MQPRICLLLAAQLAAVHGSTTLQQTPEAIMVQTNETVMLYCTCPSATVFWLRQRRVLSKDSDLEFLASWHPEKGTTLGTGVEKEKLTVSRETTRSVLSLTSVEPADTGVYFCMTVGSPALTFGKGTQLTVGLPLGQQQGLEYSRCAPAGSWNQEWSQDSSPKTPSGWNAGVPLGVLATAPTARPSSHVSHHCPAHQEVHPQEESVPVPQPSDPEGLALWPPHPLPAGGRRPGSAGIPGCGPPPALPAEESTATLHETVLQMNNESLSHVLL
ncbi:T-cell surface glycoprotein CD8 beta chain isoform X1 [Oryctolagus cuniculus]|uniref:T-cell surface glycoprotein CD8 beta chain isoform X1 n=1 Tax=Oryctolagus cuniculus TaxID=9986 RepID=UPI00387A7752